MPYIYALSDPFTGLVRYIGKANDVSKRMKQHYSQAQKNKLTFCSRWIRSLLLRNNVPIVHVLEQVSEEDWRDAEKLWISYYTWLGAPLTNLTEGGDGAIPNEINGDEYRRRVSMGVRRWMATDPDFREKCGRATRGKKLSAEWHAKIGAAQIGKHISSEAIEKARITRRSHSIPPREISDKTRAKLSKSLTGRKFSDEHKARLSAARLGKKIGPFTPEHRAAISIANKGRVFSEETRARMCAAKQDWMPSPELVARVKECVAGEGNGRAKLTIEQIAEIKRRRIEERLTLMQLSAIYGVHFSQIGRILRGNAWRNSQIK